MTFSCAAQCMMPAPLVNELSTRPYGPNGWFVPGPDARCLPPRRLESHGRPQPRGGVMPNLVASKTSPMQDVMTGSVPGEPAPFTPSPQFHPSLADSGTTRGLLDERDGAASAQRYLDDEVHAFLEPARFNSTTATSCSPRMSAYEPDTQTLPQALHVQQKSHADRPEISATRH
ncbi:hypothetical protein K438DRAFT_1942695 [Mycena galopus ATCC 62051]|nr:hypothetical protein K438DRAFT_1942695 [Mycena galopus ATCC 62051]